MDGTATRTESLLRPREIQVRIRSGQTPETVAAAAQTTVDRVMAFATPVLAERAFVAQQAAKASVRRRAGDGPVGTLGDAVARRLESAGLDAESADWDAWRREDGRWTVVAEYAEAGDDRRAEFTYDAIGRYVVAEDDTARWLVGERRAVEPAPAPNPTPAPTPAVASVGSVASVPPVVEAEPGQLALGEDALRVVTGQPLSPLPTLAAVDDPPTPAAGPAAGPPGEPATDPAAALAADPAGQAAEEPTEDLTETARAVRAVAAPPAEGEGLFEDAGLRTPAEVPERRASSSTTRPATRPRSRRSMPSWDDIVLGSAPRGD